MNNRSGIKERGYKGERLSLILDTSPMAMAITRIKDGRITDVNNAWGRESGFSKEETVGHTCSELNCWADPDERDLFSVCSKKTAVQEI